MDGIRSWATTACLAALAAGIAGIIAPSGKLEKVYRFAVSLFFLCCLLVPLFNMQNINLGNITLPQTQYGTASTSLQDTVNMQTQEIADQNISQLVDNCCLGCGITPVTVNVKFSGTSGNLTVQSVEVVLKAADMGSQQNVKDAIKNKLGIDAEVKEGEK